MTYLTSNRTNADAVISRLLSCGVPFNVKYHNGDIKIYVSNEAQDTLQHILKNLNLA